MSPTMRIDERVAILVPIICLIDERDKSLKTQSGRRVGVPEFRVFAKAVKADPVEPFRQAVQSSYNTAAD